MILSALSPIADRHFAIVILWIAAGICAVLLYRGKSMFAHAGMILVLSVFSWLADRHAPANPSEIVRPVITSQSLVAAERSPSIVDDAHSTVDGEPSLYFASSLDRVKKVYHLSGCQYAPLITHRQWFTDERAASAAGYVPCSKCLGTAH